MECTTRRNSIRYHTTDIPSSSKNSSLGPQLYAFSLHTVVRSDATGAHALNAYYYYYYYYWLGFLDPLSHQPMKLAGRLGRGS